MSDKENKPVSNTLKELENMTPEQQHKLFNDTVSALSFDESDIDLEALKKHFEENGPLDLSDIGKPLDLGALSVEGMSDKEFEIPRDENGKIDISKLPEEIRDTMELIASLFSESTAESEEIIEQMIKVCRENSGTFPEFPFDLPVIRQNQMPSRAVGEAETTGLDLIHQRNMQLLGPDRNKAEMFDFSKPILRGYAKGMKDLMQSSRSVALEMSQTPQPLHEAKLPTESGSPDRKKLIRTFGEAEAMRLHVPESSPGMPFFDATIARRRLYKDLIVRLNKEIEQGPLAGLIFVTGVTRGQPMNRAESAVFKDEILFKIEVKMTKDRFGYPAPSFKAGNRTRAYLSYYGSLFDKYRKEIRDAETKVMERE